MDTVTHQDHPRLLASGERLCGKCGKQKQSSEFYLSSVGVYSHWCKECSKEHGKLTRNPEEELDKQLWYNYGITRADYNALLEEQSGVCAACGQPESHTFKGKDKPKNLAVDHSHAFDAVRGLLCAECNLALGYMHDNPERIKALLKYVEERCLL